MDNEDAAGMIQGIQDGADATAKMEADDIRKRLSNKAHIFAHGALVCARCGYSMIDALSTPIRCTGVTDALQVSEPPMTLTQAIDSAENPR